MRSIKFFVAACALGATVTATPATAQDPFSWTGRLASGRTLEVKGISGNIEAVAASGDQARVTARKRGNRSDPADVTIEVVEHANGVTICAVYPSPRNREPNECRPGSGGRSNTSNNDVNVEFSVEVPRGVRFVGKNVNGNVTATSLTGDVVATTVNGRVRVSTSGLAEATSVNGNVDVRIGQANWNGELKFESVNGTVTVEMPEDVNAEVTASTVNGSISSDFPLTVRGRFGPKRLTGTIGSGGRSLVLSTVNGSIELKRR
jgi:hypothetical protein